MANKHLFNGDDRIEFAKIMAILGATYSKEITPEMLRAYELALSDQPIRSVKELALRHMREGVFFPRPSELRRKDYAKRWHALRQQGHAQLEADRKKREQWAIAMSEPKRLTYEGLDE